MTVQQGQKRVVFLSQVFYPEDVSTGKLMTDLASELTVQGVDVTAICGQPSYYDFGRAPSRIEHDGVHILRPPTTWFRKDNLLGRAVNILTYVMGTLLHCIRRREKGPLIILTTPPFLGLVGYICKRLHGTKYVMLIHDIYPDVLLRSSHRWKDGGWLARIWRGIHRLIYAHTDGFVVLGRDMAAVIEDQDPSPNALERIAIIPNWTDVQAIVPKRKENSVFWQEHNIGEAFTLLYSGNMGTMHNVDILIDAMARLQREDTQLLFIGGGKKLPTARKHVEELELKNVAFFPYQPLEMLGESLTACDVHVAVLDSAYTGLAVPCKLYGMLAAGKAIIVVCDEDCEMAHVIREEECGHVVAPGNTEGLVEAIRYLRDHPEERQTMGTRSRHAAETKYTIHQIVNHYRQLLEKLA